MLKMCLIMLREISCYFLKLLSSCVFCFMTPFAFLLLQEKWFEVPGALQDGSEPLGIHGHRLRHEGVRLEPGQGLRLREGAAHRHQAQPQLHAAAGGIPRDPAGQVSGRSDLDLPILSRNT